MSVHLPRPGRSRAVAVTAVACLAGVLVLDACSSSSSSTAASAATTSSGSSGASTGSLASVCPSTIKIQTSWYPNGDKASIYNIVGPNGTMDAKDGVYSGKVDGVTVEILSGGPFDDNQSSITQMYSDPSIMFGEVNTDDAIDAASQHPVIAVVATMQKSPMAVIYDPSVYNFTTLADVGKSGATVLKAGENAASDLLVAAGDIKASQFNYSYTGSPSMFITSGGKDVIMDYASEAVYQLESSPQWGKPMKYILLATAGYTSYEDALTVTPATQQKYGACLKKFVPVMQQAFVNLVKDPTAMNKTLVRYSAALKNSQDVTYASTVFADKVLEENGIWANGTDGVAGSFNTTRVTGLISRMSKLQSKLKTTISSSLTAADIVTNEYLDPSIKFSSGS